MRQTFQVQNVKCEGCATTLKKKLTPVFGDVDVDLSVHPRQITLEVTPEMIPQLGELLKKLGYPLATEELGTLEDITAKTKSFVSCAIGKIDK